MSKRRPERREATRGRWGWRGRGPDASCAILGTGRRRAAPGHASRPRVPGAVPGGAPQTRDLLRQPWASLGAPPGGPDTLHPALRTLRVSLDSFRPAARTAPSTPNCVTRSFTSTQRPSRPPSEATTSPPTSLAFSAQLVGSEPSDLGVQDPLAVCEEPQRASGERQPRRGPRPC